MGNSLNFLPNQRGDLEEISFGKGRKRKRDDEGANDNEGHFDIDKRKRLLSTSSYIYQTLFLNGENADVCIKAFDRSWQLHKVYLRQANYFASMFNGAWKEADMREICLEIPDEKITPETLHIAFQSLYTDNVNIPVDNIIGVLAAASLIGLDGLMNVAVDLLKDNLSAVTVCDYHEAVEMYCGSSEDSLCCVRWLCRNLLVQQSVLLLHNLSHKLLSLVLNCPDLCVIQVETDLYYLLKKWLFLKKNSTWNGTLKELASSADTFYKSLDKNNGSLLQQSDGEIFISLFRCLRLSYVLNDAVSVKIVEQDNIIPRDWLLEAYREMWLRLLDAEQGVSSGLNDDQFDLKCMRCARVLKTEGSYYWRWTGFNFGIDLLLSYLNRSFMIKRNTLSKPSSGAVSLIPCRNIMYRLTVFGTTKTGFSEPYQTTGLKTLGLMQDQEVVIMKIPQQIKFPLLVSFQFYIQPPSFTIIASQQNTH